ncbi:MAG TPA: hypothetical protein VM536_11245 [Chloroflexia bacterium]|nr:hypothetical protein [Chloroflexia bacterium]
MTTRYALVSGGALMLGAPLGVGGEATVYGVAGEATRVAKIYRAPSGVRAAKQRAKVARPPEDPAGLGHLSIAWPTDLVQDGNGTPVGFLMPRAGPSRPLLALYNPQTRLEEAPDFTWEYLLRTATNLARVVRALHAQGYVVGDLNESNLLVSNTALVTLIDCDSVQVPAGADGRIFRCPVGKPEYTPPELQGIDFRMVDRVPAHDHFGLAVLIFLLLMEGVHPFTGVWMGAGNPPTLEANIAAGRCPYVGAPDIAPPPYGLAFSTLPPDLQALMRRCFGAGHVDPPARPSAADWVTALELAEGTLATCRVNHRHRYSAHLGTDCPWCARIRRLRVPDPFPLPGQAAPRAARPTRSTPGVGPRAAADGGASAVWVGSAPAAPTSTTGGFCFGCVVFLFVILFIGGMIVEVPAWGRLRAGIERANTPPAVTRTVPPRPAATPVPGSRHPVGRVTLVSTAASATLL